MEVFEKLMLLIYITCCSLLIVNGAIDPEVINKSVERNIDISTQLVKITHKIQATHTGKKPFSKYSFLVNEKEHGNLSFISIKDLSTKKEFKAQENKISAGYEYEITFPSTNNQHLHIECVFTKSLIPHPSKITQNEKQLVRYFGNAYFYTPYQVLTQKTTIQLPTSTVEYSTNVPMPVVQSGSRISYGPYENIDPLQISEIIVHYENQTPFLSVTRLERVIEISHWGNIAVEETIDMTHSGAELKGPFSRYDFQKDVRSGQSSIKNYKTILPASATGVYYRDTNGNISTSNMKIMKDSVELDLRPRFPLFGGWKTHYTIGYNVPSFEYLFNNGNDYLLKMRVIDHIFDDMVVEDATVKIILPEGASNVKLISPYPVNRKEDTLHFTYLDTFGRPVITFTKTNLVENHIHDFNVKYNFSNLNMLQEPFLVIIFFFILFGIVIVFIRLDFSIYKEKEN
ncbi:RPN1 family protein [Megaselia abdita]